MLIPIVSTLLIVIALLFIIAIAVEVFIDDYVKPKTMFMYLLISTILTSIISYILDVDIPRYN